MREARAAFTWRRQAISRTGFVFLTDEVRAMALLRRLAAAITLLLSAVGIVGCVAGIISIWTFYQSVSDKVQTISARLDVGLERASVAGENVQRALETARTHMANVGEKSADLGGGGEQNRLAARAVRTLIAQQAGL